jgi:prefoldin alpha subunit
VLIHSFVVNLDALSVQQLSQIKKQFDDEVTHLTNSYQNLRVAQQKFKDCVLSVKDGVAGSAQGEFQPITVPTASFMFSNNALDKTLLVPLTSSLYVPGKLASTSHVLVDVGTGFYVEKSTDDALTFYNGKIEELAGNIKELENVVNGKANNLRMIEEVLRQKMLVQQQGQAQQAAGAAAA